MVNGKEHIIPLELTTEQINNLLSTVQVDEKFTGWEKPAEDEGAYYEDALGRIQSLTVDSNSQMQVDLLYAKANCYASKTIAKNIARGDLLIRQLRRVAVESRDGALDRLEGGYTITYNYLDKCLEIGATGNWMALGDIVFGTEEAARSVMSEYADELIWYFTEMRESLRDE